jgi:hypothetical protein
MDTYFFETVAANHRESNKYMEIPTQYFAGLLL